MNDIENKLTTHEVKLDIIISKLDNIEKCLYGDNAKAGLRIDVDRLKRARTTHLAVLWVFFTTIVGTAATVFGRMFGGN